MGERRGENEREGVMGEGRDERERGEGESEMRVGAKHYMILIAIACGHSVA